MSPYYPSCSFYAERSIRLSKSMLWPIQRMPRMDDTIAMTLVMSYERGGRHSELVGSVIEKEDEISIVWLLFYWVVMSRSDNIKRVEACSGIFLSSGDCWSSLTSILFLLNLSCLLSVFRFFSRFLIEVDLSLNRSKSLISFSFSEEVFLPLFHLFFNMLLRVQS